MHDPTTGYAGVDWATDAHAVCVVDGEGRVVVEFDVAHSADGLARAVPTRRSAPVHAGSRSSDPTGPSSTRCSTAGLEVVVVSPAGR